MTKMIMLRNPNDDMQDKLNKFWTSLSAWMEQQEVIEKYFRGEYTEYDNGWNGGTFYLNIDYEQEYKIQYGESYPEFAIGNRGINIDDIKDYVEIMYERWIKADMHYSFTVEINKRFNKFQLPYKLSSGSVIGKGYKTTESIEVILDHRMFERKIAYSEEMIMSNEMLDKKCALDYIVDALQYFISVQKPDGVDKKYAAAARGICSNQDSKIYAVVKAEISEVMKLSNEYFDIRHNEYLNKAKEKREALEDLQFIEYLYNRVYALLYLLGRKFEMNIQIFGTKKCNDTKKAERFFKERGIKYQFIDMKEKGMSKGEFNSVAQANGGLENMINWDGKDKDLLALIKYIADEDKLEKVLENPQIIKTPVVRNGKQSTLGYQPDVWKGWK